ncbi:DUF1501 domain-containing protein, partial [Verrucomicrobiales bacterium]|nr:DUF1501 domain-containing protein [Verrucomicrobiales bacterium]
MNQINDLSPIGRDLLNRRTLMANTGFALGGLGLTSILAEEKKLNFSGKSTIVPKLDPKQPYLARSQHFSAKAKKVLMIYCPGAVSHVDTFDYKPALEKQHGKKADYIPKVTFEGPPGNVAKSFWDFKPRGQTGKMVSDLLPNMAELVDDFCF